MQTFIFKLKQSDSKPTIWNIKNKLSEERYCSTIVVELLNTLDHYCILANRSTLWANYGSVLNGISLIEENITELSMDINISLKSRFHD